jgi:DNA polymerase IV (DinB-like DNA polymerase)
MIGESPRIILHLDMDSFYASVEVREHPDLRSKPVVIGADPKHGKGRGVVSTCSYEAREYGIRSAMPISQAYILCPHAIFLPPDFPLYVRSSAEVMAFLKSQGFRYEQVSIDEAFLDVTLAGSFDAAQSLAERMQNAIKTDLGLSCSIGIGPSKLVAKIASDYRKPGGITVVTPAQVKDFLSPLLVRKIPGIGSKTEKELFDIGIRTIGDLAACDVQVLLARFGRGAIVLHEAAAGVDRCEVVERSGPRSISREITFDEDTVDPDVIALTLDELVRDVHQSLVEEGLRFRTITVKIRYQGFITKTRARSVSHHTDDIATIRKHAQSLISELFSNQQVRLVGLRLSGFESGDSRQAMLDV